MTLISLASFLQHIVCILKTTKLKNINFSYPNKTDFRHKSSIVNSGSASHCLELDRILGIIAVLKKLYLQTRWLLTT